uniref:Putative hydrolase protein n=2 Tax=gamma proteobacterium D250 TaxID=649546 RepID=M4HXH8_9GAMM|nr:putative hydrolase protein [gamma proteobacterium D250]
MTAKGPNRRQSQLNIERQSAMIRAGKGIDKADYMSGNKKASITINDHSIHFYQEGLGDPILFVHGALADARMWEDHCKILSREFKVTAFTQRHFGNPGYSSKDPFGIDTHAHDLVGLIDGLAIGPVHLVGWSYGADVSLSAAIKAPHLFKSLYLYEPEDPGYLNTEARAKYHSEAKATFTDAYKAVADNQLDIAVKKLIDDFGKRADYFSQQLLRYRIQQLDNAHTLSPQLNQTEQPAINANKLSKISIPTSVVCGSETHQMFKIVAYSAATLIPGAHLLEVNSANHMLPREEPVRFCQLVKESIHQKFCINSE